MQFRSRATPSGGSAILEAWRTTHGPEAQRLQAMGARAGVWGGPGRHQLQQLSGNGGRALKSFMAASNDRLVADMGGYMADSSGNAEVRSSLKAMRRRSRQLANDNEWVKRFLQLLRDNVVGPRGFAFQSKVYKARKKAGAQELDTDANGAIETFYAAQSKLGNFSACGGLNRATFERALITGLARDGEVIVEKLLGAQFGPYAIAWRMLDPDLLDETLNVATNGVVQGHGRLADGHEVRMGVERNAYSRPVAFWFLTVHPGDDLAKSYIRHRRVTADRILHLFVRDESRPDTARGVPWMFAAIRRMAMLGGYEEAALVSARQGASKMGFYKRPATEQSPIGTPNADGTAVADGEDVEGNLITEAEPGTFGMLPAGWDFTTYDPAYPNDAMAGFIKGMLRAFSSGVGLTYNTIGNDLEGVSLSSLRHGATQDRDTYEAIQQWFVDHVCVPMYEPALQMALTFGRVGSLPPDAFERLNKPRFIPRPFRSPDPQKDVAAGAQQVALGTNSRTRLCAENGLDYEEVLQELADEEAMARSLGVTLGVAVPTSGKNPASDTAAPKPAAPGAADDSEIDPEKETADDTP